MTQTNTTQKLTNKKKKIAQKFIDNNYIVVSVGCGQTFIPKNCTRKLTLPNTTQNKEELRIPEDLSERDAKKYLIMRSNLALLKDETGTYIRNTILNDYYLELKKSSQAHQSGIEEARKAILEEVRREVIGEMEVSAKETSYKICKCGNYPNGKFCEECGKKSIGQEFFYPTERDTYRNELRFEQKQKLSLLEGEK